MKTYLVTGGAGFIGSHLVDRLLALNNRVVVIDNLSTGKLENLPKGNENLIFYKLDILGNLENIFSSHNFDAVFHLAASISVQKSIEDPDTTRNINEGGTNNLLNECRKFNVKRFIFSSSCAVYEPDSSPYAEQKLNSEKRCKLFTDIYGLETISLRYFNIFGPRQDPNGDYAAVIPKFIQRVDNNEPPKIKGDGNQTRDFVYVIDIVKANILAANTSNENCFGRTFNIGSGKNYTINELADLIIKISGKNIKPIYTQKVQEMRDSLADIQDTKRELSWEPSIDLNSGLREIIDYGRK